ncbi:hypothetical protein [Flavobacterium sp.]|uniref:hypothetical protein n=1 Tax=Flavobacterium sp. TaxID=239 RepID=UPI003D6C01AC
MKKSMFFFFLICSQLIFCQTNYYLEGKLGKSTIYMTIEGFSSEDNEVNATYFYQNSLKDIPLSGIRNKDKYELAFRSGENPEKFELTKLPNKKFKGFWISNSGKKITLELQPINFLNYKSYQDSGKEGEKLNGIKSGFIEYKKDSTSVYKGKNFDWYSEKHCKSSFFRLGNNFPEEERKKINSILEKIHLEETQHQLSCSGSFEYNNGAGIDTNVKISFLNTNLLGFEVFSYWDCGGAHPDFGGKGYLIDLHSGKNYSIDEVLAFDKSVTVATENNFKNFSEYRKNHFAPKLFTLINNEQHFEKPKETDEDSCDYTDLEFWQFVSWNYTEEGIQFTPIFYRAARNCEEPFLVPFNSLEKYKNPLFPYKILTR